MVYQDNVFNVAGVPLGRRKVGEEGKRCRPLRIPAIRSLGQKIPPVRHPRFLSETRRSLRAAWGTGQGGKGHSIRLSAWSPGVPGGAIHIESGYQSGHGSGCAHEDCTAISDIVFRNNTFKDAGGTGSIVCFPNRPCQNVTFDDVHVLNAGTAPGWGCSDVARPARPPFRDPLCARRAHS